jgi:predicted ArsR family transcriptional regulator
MSGAYCKQYGNTIRNKVIEHFLENDGTHISAGQMAKELKISRQKAYEEIKDLINIKYIKKSKIISKIQIYELNKKNPRVLLFEKNFLDCLKLIGKQQTAKDSMLEEQNKLLKELVKEINELKEKISAK